MIKDLLFCVIGVIFLATVCEMILPKGNFIKYFRLMTGFIMMSILISPFANKDYLLNFDLSMDEYLSESEITADSDAYILKLHEENIRKRIIELCGEKTQPFIELYTDGRVKSVRLKGSGISGEIIETLKAELGCDNISIINGE